MALTGSFGTAPRIIQIVFATLVCLLSAASIHSLSLPKRKREELAQLLRETSLSSIIGAAKVVADRIKFLNGLEAVLFDPDPKKRFKERTQLHKIIAQNTWLFGEEFSLSVNDQSLTAALIEHKKELKTEIVIDEPVIFTGENPGLLACAIKELGRTRQPSPSLGRRRSP